jgi:hypothetical protein
MVASWMGLGPMSLFIFHLVDGSRDDKVRSDVSNLATYESSTATTWFSSRSVKLITVSSSGLPGLYRVFGTEDEGIRLFEFELAVQGFNVVWALRSKP